MKVKLISAIALSLAVAGCFSGRTNRSASASTSALSSRSQAESANDYYVKIVLGDDSNEGRIFAAAAKIDYGKCPKAIEVLSRAYRKTGLALSREAEKKLLTERLKSTGNLDLFKAICKHQDAAHGSLMFHQEVLDVARSVVKAAEPPEPVYEVKDYKKVFAKMTPEKIAEAFIKANKGESKHSVYKMAKAIDWSKGFAVAKLINRKIYNEAMWSHFHEAIYDSLSNLPDQQTVKAAVDQLPEKSEWLDWGYNKGTRYYEKVINQITDPAVADYMLSRNLFLQFKIGLLVKKLSAAKKAELVAAAKDRAGKCKDKIVMEGFYLGMPYLDAEILADNLGLNIPSEKGSTRNLISFSTSDFKDDKNLKMADCKVNGITLLPKGWVKFIDVDDDMMLPYQFIHQYVDRKTGKAGKLDYLGKVKLEVSGDYAGHWVYSNTKLGTRVCFSESWWIEFDEI